MMLAYQQYNAGVDLGLGERGASGIFNTNALANRQPFSLTAHELDANFRLTRFASLKGEGCKVPQEVLLKLVYTLIVAGLLIPRT